MKNKLKAEEGQAMQWFCKEKRAVPMMSIFPFEVNFKMKDTNEKYTTNLQTLVQQHKEHKEEEAKERARKQRQASTNTPRYTRFG